MDGTGEAEAVLQPYDLWTVEKQIKPRLNSATSLARSVELPQEWVYSS